MQPPLLVGCVRTAPSQAARQLMDCFEQELGLNATQLASVESNVSLERMAVVKNAEEEIEFFVQSEGLDLDRYVNSPVPEHGKLTRLR